MNRAILPMAILLALACAAEVCQGQAPAGPPPAGRYQPSRPTVSPYLNLLRRNTGPLPNYYSLVRPQLQQLETNQRQQVLNTQQQGELRNLDRRLQITESPVASTGARSVFRNYSNFYTMPR
jgi:hypothetical protein